MDLIKREKLNREIGEPFAYRFTIEKNGWHLIEITASAQSWWQNMKQWRSFFQDDDLTVKIDATIFPKLSGKRGLFDGEVAWNGNNLKGLTKTAVLICYLADGDHSLQFLVDGRPRLESIAILKVKNLKEVVYTPQENNPSQDGERRQWLTIVIINAPLETIILTARAGARGSDDDDVKLIINGKTELNLEPKGHKYWYWCGRTLQGREKTLNKDLNLLVGLHYLEFWADKTPFLVKIGIMFGSVRKHWEEGSNDPIKTANGFNANYVLQDIAFNNKETMGEQNIQLFLESHGAAYLKTVLILTMTVIMLILPHWLYFFLARSDKPAYLWQNNVSLGDGLEVVGELKIFSQKEAAEEDGLYCGFRFGKIYEASAKLLLTRRGKVLESMEATDPELVLPNLSERHLTFYKPFDIDGDGQKQEFVVRRYGACNGDIFSFIRADKRRGQFEKIPIVHRGGQENFVLYGGLGNNGFSANRGTVAIEYYDNSVTPGANGFFEDWYRYNKINNKLEWFKQERL